MLHKFGFGWKTQFQATIFLGGWRRRIYFRQFYANIKKVHESHECEMKSISNLRKIMMENCRLCCRFSSTSKKKCTPNIHIWCCCIMVMLQKVKVKWMSHKFEQYVRCARQRAVDSHGKLVNIKPFGIKNSLITLKLSLRAFQLWVVHLTAYDFLEKKMDNEMKLIKNCVWKNWSEC